jgi:hypothetical protein
MKKYHGLLIASLALAGATFSMTAQADPPPWAHDHRVHEVRDYRYVYYPDAQVYFAPATHTWFWLNGGAWQFGVNLPNRIRVYGPENGIPVVLHSDRPYTEHVYVEEHYGRPWRERHHHKHGYEHDHDHDRYWHDEHRHEHDHDHDHD